MVKKILVAILIPLLLTSCTSITADTESPLSQPRFVTATLAPTAIGWMPATSTALPEAGTPSPVVTPPAYCTNAAILLQDVTIPDDTQVTAGENFTKTWEFQNTGTCPWIDYTMKFSSGDVMNAPLSAPITDTLPNEKVQASVELTAPTGDGRYAGYFSLLNSNGEVIPIGTQKTFWVKFIVGADAVVPTTSGANLVQSGNCIHSQNTNYVSEIIALINAERANAGVQTLIFNTEMAAFAQSHAEDMAFNNFLSHDGSNGSFGERMAGYGMTHSGYFIGGEILAIGTPQNAMDQWRRDEHWDYVLRPHYTQIGVGYAFNSCSDFGGYFTVDLS